MTRYDLLLTGFLLCLTIILWVGKNLWIADKMMVKTKFDIIYIIGMIIFILALLMPSVNAYNWCEKEGYDYCVEQKETIKGETLTSKIAINLYDEKGDKYDKFSFSGFAIGGFYADIYYEGQEIYINKNITSWDKACTNQTGIMICKGEMMRTEGKKITLQLSRFHEEYIGCPLFISKLCNDNIEWCEWAGIGYLSPINNTCPHIRVTECYYDEDCPSNQYCDKISDKYNWKNWTCKERPPEVNNITNTTRNNSRGYTTNKPTGNGNTFTYNAEDLAPSLWDNIIKILKSIGNFFSGLAGN